MSGSNWDDSEGYFDVGRLEGKEWEKIKKEREKIEKNKEDEFQKILEDAGKEIISKEFSKTLVCDGAVLSCPMATFEFNEPSVEEAGYGYMPESFGYPQDKMIEFLVPDPHVFLMGKDPIGTVENIKPENFEPDPHLFCKKTNKPCDIKNKAFIWLNYAKELKINGNYALLKESVLKCKNCPSANITFTDNGQDQEIKNAEMTKFFSNFGWNPTTKKVTKSIMPAIQICKGIGIMSLGISSIIMSEGVLAPIGVPVTGIGSVDVFDGTRDLGEIWFRKDILFEGSKGIISFMGVNDEKSEEYAEYIVGGYETVMFLKGIKELAGDIESATSTFAKNADIIDDNREIEKEIERINEKIEKYNKKEAKSQLTAKEAQKRRRLEWKKRRLKLSETEKYSSLGDIGEDMAGRIINRMDPNELDYKLEIEYSKNNFFTNQYLGD